MLKYPRLSLGLVSVAICTIALFLCSCETITGPSSRVTVLQLVNAHLAFINHYTCAEGSRPTWDQASFNKEVADITQQFTDAEAAVSKTVPARKQLIRNSANLFRRDAALVQRQHCLSPSFADNKKKQLQQNYDLLRNQTSDGGASLITTAESPPPQLTDWMAAESPAPQFTPWPPPLASAVAVLPRKLLVGEKGSGRLKDVNARLTSAFEQCGYSDRSYYSVPGGFAIASRIEQINKDGSPSTNRWSLALPYMEELSVKAYLRALFKAPVGHYRVIVFVVTPYSFLQAKTEISASEAEALVSHGANALPEQIGHREYLPAYDCTALIYEFRRTEHKAEFVRPSEISSHMHLQNAGLLAALSQP